MSINVHSLVTVNALILKTVEPENRSSSFGITTLGINDPYAPFGITTLMLFFGITVLRNNDPFFRNNDPSE